MLERAGTDEAALALLFTPELPVVLPSFEPNPLASDATRAATGHVEVEFVITKYGRARAIQIRDAANAADRARADLVDEEQPVPAAADGWTVRRFLAGRRALRLVRLSRRTGCRGLPRGQYNPLEELRVVPRRSPK